MGDNPCINDPPLILAADHPEDKSLPFMCQEQVGKAHWLFTNAQSFGQNKSRGPFSPETGLLCAWKGGKWILVTTSNVYHGIVWVGAG